jgi:thiol-disulfide isomerase/thioredoxin
MIKNLLLAAMLVFMCPLLVMAQTDYSNNFEGGFGDITVVDVDGQVPAANIANTTPTGSWAVAAIDGDDAAVSTSWYAPPGQSDDWMMTPAITVSADAILRWESKAQDPSYPDGYSVYVSTTGNTVADFATEVFSVAADATEWGIHTVDLSSYAGSDVYVAFRNNSNDQFLLYLDDIWVGVPAPLDLKMNSAAALKILPGATTFDVALENNGLNDITSFNIVITEDGAEIINEEVTATFTTGESYTYSAPLTLVDGPDTKTYSATITGVNGGMDGDDSNNTAEDQFVVRPLIPQFAKNDSYGNASDLHAELASGKAVVLDFLASWCGPCASSTPELNSFYVNNGGGTTNSTVWGVTVESSDDDNAVNNLGWGGTYPKFSYTLDNDIQYFHYASQRTHALNTGGSIPFFVMICPNTASPKDSEVYYNEVGYGSGLEGRFTAELNACTSVGVNTIETLSAMTIFPNPTSKQLNIDFTLESKTDLAIEIFNMMGQKVQSFSTVSYDQGFHSEAIDVSSFANGAYIATIRSDKGVISTQFNVVK